MDSLRLINKLNIKCKIFSSIYKQWHYKYLDYHTVSFSQIVEKKDCCVVFMCSVVVLILVWWLCYDLQQSVLTQHSNNILWYTVTPQHSPIPISELHIYKLAVSRSVELLHFYCLLDVDDWLCSVIFSELRRIVKEKLILWSSSSSVWCIWSVFELCWCPAPGR